MRQIRDTRHGFDLLFRRPARPGVYRGGLPRLIATRPLADFWEAHQTKQRVLFDLPVGRTTLKRVRSRLGYNYRQDVAEFWQERIADLASLKSGEFARPQGPHVRGVGYTKETARQVGPPGGLVA